MLGHKTIIAVHAGLGQSDVYEQIVQAMLGPHFDLGGFATQAGHIIGLMRLTGRQYTSMQQVVESAPEQIGWWSGPYGYEIASAEALPDPVQCRHGFHRGWWTVPDDVVGRVLEQLPDWATTMATPPRSSP